MNLNTHSLAVFFLFVFELGCSEVDLGLDVDTDSGGLNGFLAVP